jgi:hypothetical protein
LSLRPKKEEERNLPSKPFTDYINLWKKIKIISVPLRRVKIKSIHGCDIDTTFDLLFKDNILIPISQSMTNPNNLRVNM